MRINLDALLILDALERHGSFAAAAAALFKTPSALSYMVQKLESDLDITLLDRSGHRAKFTDTGKLMLDKGRILLRAAQDLEQQARYVESGWESDLSLAVDASFPFERLLPLIDEFYRHHHHTRLRFSHEVLAGSWEALVYGCADIIIGAICEPPSRAGFSFSPLGRLEYIFTVAPHHPLATLPEPLLKTTIRQHRAVVVHDTSRVKAPQSLHVLDEQDQLTVFSFEAKLQAQLAGLGCGYLPRYLAEPYLNTGQLVAKNVEAERYSDTAYFGWRESATGLAAAWWRERLQAYVDAGSIYSSL
ncbi:LysR substrate-binding domain-containing protein [Serratia oryzae]|uniref:LysR substrate-binding domain-containing protein n=1 Tax=Serratia oryzae TaxID=2034155 RepID=UPI0012E1FB52|nr:LysR substrate-binding domain-containing protein [Serratia oryzae]VXC62258.1 putative DNA-binding transcriptional regulator [Enterobacterales bacterium 8AC]